MKTIFRAYIFCLLAFHVGAAEYRESDLQKISAPWIEVGQHITIKKFRFQDAAWKTILEYIQQESKAGDTKGKGIEIFVPEEFKSRFARNADEKWTIQLADGLDIITIFSECPPHEWMYFPIQPRRVAVIPRDALIRDLTTNRQ
jgi:hypothetical protein